MIDGPVRWRRYRCLVGQELRDADIVGRPLDGYGRQETRQSGLVGDEVANQETLLSGRAELRPVAANRGIEIEELTLEQEQQAGRHQALGTGEDAHQGVLAPGHPPASVRQPCPQVDRRHAVNPGRKRRPDLTFTGEVLFKSLPHDLETWCHVPADDGR